MKIMKVEQFHWSAKIRAYRNNRDKANNGLTLALTAIDFNYMTDKELTQTNQQIPEQLYA